MTTFGDIALRLRWEPAHGPTSRIQQDAFARLGWFPGLASFHAGEKECSAVLRVPAVESLDDYTSAVANTIRFAAADMCVRVDLVGRKLRRRRGRLAAWREAVEPQDSDVWGDRSEPMLAWLRRRKAPPSSREVVAWGKKQRMTCDPMEVMSWLETQGAVAWVRGCWVVRAEGATS